MPQEHLISGSILPEYLTLSLVRVFLEPRFKEVPSGEPDVLLRRVAGICSRKLSLGRNELLGCVCNKLSGYRVRKGLRNEEIKLIKGAARDLSMTSPPALMIESYSFGLASYRVSSTFKPTSEDGLLDSWRNISRVFRQIIDSRMPKIPGSLSSKFFSEIYAFYELNVDPASLRVLWPNIEGSLVPSEADPFLSPFKTLSEPASSELIWIPDPARISPDGLLVRFFYSRTREGKRRCVHTTRRKKRRIQRIAVDLVLGLKIFLENQDLWFKDPETCWGAFVGMICLNPDVTTELWRLTGRRFIYIYEGLLRKFGLIDKFRNYEKLFWFPFHDDLQVASFLDAVRILGGSPPEKAEAYSLNNIQLDALKLIVLKSQLDLLLMPWDDLKLLGLARYLCWFLRNHSEAIARIGSTSAEECVEEFLSHISSRRKRRGLTYIELSCLLAPVYGDRARVCLAKSSSLLRKLTELGLVEEGIDLRGRKSGGKRKGFKVRFYIPSKNKLVELMERTLSGLSQQAAERIMKLHLLGS